MGQRVGREEAPLGSGHAANQSILKTLRREDATGEQVTAREAGGGERAAGGSSWWAPYPPDHCQSIAVPGARRGAEFAAV